MSDIMLDTVSKLVIKDFGYEPNKEVVGTAAWCVNMLHRECIGRRRAGNILEGDTVAYCIEQYRWRAGVIKGIVSTGFIVSDEVLRMDVVVPYVSLLTDVYKIDSTLVERMQLLKDMRLVYEDNIMSEYSEGQIKVKDINVLDETHTVNGYLKAILEKGGSGKIWIDDKLYTMIHGKLEDMVDTTLMDKQVKYFTMQMQPDGKLWYQMCI